MSFFSPLLVVYLLQRMTGGKILHIYLNVRRAYMMIGCSLSLVIAMGCDVDGDIRLDFVQNGTTVNQREHRLIQVCLFGQWSYVCNWDFGHEEVDSNVVLQQLQCQNGGKVLMFLTISIIYNYTRNHISWWYFKPHTSISHTSGLCWS